MNGDEWGLYDILPAENAAQFGRVIGEFREHHKDTDFAPTGWSTPPYVIRPPDVAIASRGIRIAELESILGGVMPKAAGVDSCVDFTGKPYPCPECFAFALSLENYWQCEGFYGPQKDEIVQALNVTDTLTATREQLPAIVDAIVRLGRQFDLVLLANAYGVVDLRDAGEVTTFINAENESASP